MTQNALAGVFNPYLKSPRLTESQRSKLAVHIFQRFGLVHCDFCKMASWAIGENLVSPLPLAMNHFQKTFTVDHTVVQASVHLVCMNCGNSKLLHLAHLQWDPFAPENQ